MDIEEIENARREVVILLRLVAEANDENRNVVGRVASIEVIEALDQSWKHAERR